MSNKENQKANNLTRIELEAIKKIANRIKNQDTQGKIFGTKAPHWFLLQDVEKRFNFNDEGMFFVYYDGDIEYFGDCYKDIYNEIVEDSNHGEVPKHLLETIESESKSFDYEYETKRIFYTFEGAEEHLKQNNYHYSPKVRIVCDHAWRDPEAELIHKLLLSFASSDEYK